MTDSSLSPSRCEHPDSNLSDLGHLFGLVPEDVVAGSQLVIDDQLADMMAEAVQLGYARPESGYVVPRDKVDVELLVVV